MSTIRNASVRSLISLAAKSWSLKAMARSSTYSPMMQMEPLSPRWMKMQESALLCLKPYCRSQLETIWYQLRGACFRP